jgi:hypothetical protein
MNQPQSRKGAIRMPEFEEFNPDQVEKHVGASEPHLTHLNPNKEKVAAEETGGRQEFNRVEDDDPPEPTPEPAPDPDPDPLPIDNEYIPKPVPDPVSSDEHPYPGVVAPPSDPIPHLDRSKRPLEPNPYGPPNPGDPPAERILRGEEERE